MVSVIKPAPAYGQGGRGVPGQNDPRREAPGKKIFVKRIVGNSWPSFSARRSYVVFFPTLWWSCRRPGYPSHNPAEGHNCNAQHQTHHSGPALGSPQGRVGWCRSPGWGGPWRRHASSAADGGGRGPSVQWTAVRGGGRRKVEAAVLHWQKKTPFEAHVHGLGGGGLNGEGVLLFTQGVPPRW